MKLHPFIASTIAFGSLTAIGLSAAQQTADGFSFKMPGRGWLQIAGACNADPEHIDCWKPTGEPEPKLTELMNAYFLINPQQRLEIRYKHRSLMLVTKSLINNTSGQGNVNFNGLQVDPGGNLNQQGNIGYNGQGEEVTMFYWYYPADSTTSVDVTAMMNVTTEGVKIPLKVDAEGSLTGGKVRFTKIEKASEGDVEPNVYGNPNAAKAPHWNVSYQLTGESSDPVTSIYAAAFDQDGNQISQVDGKGNPITPKPNERRYNGFQPYYAIAGVSANRISLLVNPDKVSSLLITGNSQRKVMFKNVALQPAK